MDPIPLLDLRAQFAALREPILQAIHRVVDSQQFILGAEVEGFEEDIARYLGVPHAVGCASGSDALAIALAALGVGPGDVVLTTPFSFFATASCAYRVGARPAFVDICPDTFNLDPGRLDDAIGPRARAILPVHLFGQCADMDPILDLARRRGLAVVEDACQALGARYRSATGREGAAGTLGDAGCYSFFPSKNLGGFGDGGLLVTRDADLARRARSLRVHGESERYRHERIGWNSRLDALQAAVLRVKLPHLDAWSRSRAANADLYDRLFRESGLVERGLVRPPPRAPHSTHIFNQYTVRARDRNRLADHLAARGIGRAIYYPIPLHLQDCFRELDHRPGDFPEAERACAEVLSLPVYPELTRAQIERVVAEIAAFYLAR